MFVGLQGNGAPALMKLRTTFPLEYYDSASGIDLQSPRSRANTKWHYDPTSEGNIHTVLPCWMIEQELADGRPELVLPDVATLRNELFAVYPSRRYLSAKVRVFIDFLVASLAMGSA